MLILASASKARHLLLLQARITHQVIASDIDESSFHVQDPKRLAQALALAKANAIADRMESKTLKEIIPQKITSILGCDSIFEFHGEVFGKPKNEKEAIDRWINMSSNSGSLHTGHALLNKALLSGKPEAMFSCVAQDVITTEVVFSKLKLSEIEAYVKTGEPFNCAGGFALEGRGGMFIEKINGCFSNVIGLSLPWLREKLTIK